MIGFFNFLEHWWFLITALLGVLVTLITFAVRWISGVNADRRAMKKLQEDHSAMRQKVEKIEVQVHENNVAHAEISTRLSHLEQGQAEIKDSQSQTMILAAEILKRL
jgi:uncharacterized membrane protein (DUF106 family)